MSLSLRGFSANKVDSFLKPHFFIIIFCEQTHTLCTSLRKCPILHKSLESFVCGVSGQCHKWKWPAANVY